MNLNLTREEAVALSNLIYRSRYDDYTKAGLRGVYNKLNRLVASDPNNGLGKYKIVRER